MTEISPFCQGASTAIAVCEVLEKHRLEDTAKRLAGAVIQMMNGYYDQLTRSNNQLETEMEVLEHCKTFMPRSLYPGDLRAEEGKVTDV